MTYERGDGDNIGTGYGSNWSSMWVFGLVVLALFVFWGRNDRKEHIGGYADGIVPALAMGNMMKGGYNGGGYHASNDALNHREHWDTLMMSLTQFGDVKKEIVAVGHANAMDNARYFYEQRGAMDRGFFDQARLTDRNNHDAQIGFKNVEIQGMQNTSEIRKEISDLRNDLKDKEIQQLTSKVNFLETVHGVRGWGVPATYPVHPPQPFNPCFA